MELTTFIKSDNIITLIGFIFVLNASLLYDKYTQAS